MIHSLIALLRDNHALKQYHARKQTFSAFQNKHIHLTATHGESTMPGSSLLPCDVKFSAMGQK